MKSNGEKENAPRAWSHVGGTGYRPLASWSLPNNYCHFFPPSGGLGVGVGRVRVRVVCVLHPELHDKGPGASEVAHT